MSHIITHDLPELDEPERSGMIVDIVKHKELAFNYNRQVARRIASNLEPNGIFI